MSTSSCQSEIIATDVGFKEVEHSSSISKEISMSTTPSIVENDNQACIRLVNHGSPLSNKSKHMKIRFQGMHDKILSEQIHMEYTKTEDTTADLGTKCIIGKQFFKLRADTQGYAESDIGLPWMTGNNPSK